MNNTTNQHRRRHTHVGVINQQMWSAHARRGEGTTQSPTPPPNHHPEGGTMLDSYRTIDNWYTRMSARNPLSEYHTARWMRIRAWLATKDPEYVWEQ